MYRLTTNIRGDGEMVPNRQSRVEKATVRDVWKRSYQQKDMSTVRDVQRDVSRKNLRRGDESQALPSLWLFFFPF